MKPSPIGPPLMALMRSGLCRVSAGNCGLNAVFRSMKLPVEPEAIRAERGNNLSV